MASSSATCRDQSCCVAQSLTPQGVRRLPVAVLAFASLALARPAVGQHAPVAVVLNAEDGKSLGLAILQLADGVSLLLPASAAVVRVAPGAAEVTSHAVRWSAAQVASVDRVTVVLHVSGDASAPGRVVVSNGTDVRTIVLSAAGACVLPASRTNAAASVPSPTSSSARPQQPSSGASWLSVASKQFGGAPVPVATSPIVDSMREESRDRAPAAPTPSPPTRPVPPPEQPDPRPLRAAVFNLASRHTTAPVQEQRAVAGAPPTPATSSTSSTSAIPVGVDRTTAIAPAASWHFAGDLVDPSSHAPAAATAPPLSLPVTTPVAAPVVTAMAPVVRETVSATPAPAYTVADLFTSTGFPKPTRITEASAGSAADRDAPADAVAVTDRWRAHGAVRVSATQSVGGVALRGAEASLERPMNGSVALTVTAGANRLEQYATAGVRVAPHAASSAALSPFLAIALGATAEDQTTATRFAVAGGVQVPVGARAMIEVGGEHVMGPGAGGGALLRVGIRALFGMGS